MRIKGELPWRVEAETDGEIITMVAKLKLPEWYVDAIGWKEAEHLRVALTEYLTQWEPKRWGRFRT